MGWLSGLTLLHCVILHFFCTKMRYVVLNGKTKEHISCRLGTENISAVIFQALTRSTFKFLLSAFQHIPISTHIGFLCSNFLKIYVSLLCHVLTVCSNPHFFLSTDVYAGQPLGALSSIISIILRGKVCGDRVNLICFVLA